MYFYKTYLFWTYSFPVKRIKSCYMSYLLWKKNLTYKPRLFYGMCPLSARSSSEAMAIKIIPCTSTKYAKDRGKRRPRTPKFQTLKLRVDNHLGRQVYVVSSSIYSIPWNTFHKIKRITRPNIANDECLLKKRLNQSPPVVSFS